MEEILQTEKKYKLDFQGKGNDFFGIIIVNWLLTICTLGIYYPWAKAKKLQFLYGQTSLNGDAFAFHGTGKEMFKGFLKAILLFFILGGIFGLFIYLKMPMVGLLLFYFGIFAILPLAIHGSYRYRMSRTSWRGIRFGYRGDKQELAINFVKWIFLTIITFGIYGPWMSINLRKYLVGNVRFGDAEFDYSGDGSDYFILNLKGYFLSIFTLGIYFFWWQKDLFEYYIDNLTVNKENKEIRLNSTVTGGGFFKLAIVNLAIIVFTLGLGYAWAVTRTLNYIFNNIQLDGNIDLDALNQTEENYKDATGEDLSDFLDLDFVM
ncbi:YjgN family protein [Flavobacterium sp. WC2421]|uniref:YjgN family protein n=1 Tax=Flavobacterium sp. WC2421 TaxID=3234138 RepID=UPI0034659DBD